ncbi:pyridoxal-phosphate dependent enzyme, partial [Bacillus pumilus]
MKWNGLIEEFQEFLPVNKSTPKLTLNEGNTPLIHLSKLSEKLGIELHVKTEGVNPTGSFKDRGMVMALSLLHISEPRRPSPSSGIAT